METDDDAGWSLGIILVCHRITANCYVNVQINQDFFLFVFTCQITFTQELLKKTWTKKNINIHSFLCWIIIKRFISVKIIQNKNPSCFTDLAVISHVPSSRRSAPVSEHSAVRWADRIISQLTEWTCKTEQLVTQQRDQNGLKPHYKGW